jgi:hypothetical protein
LLFSGDGRSELLSVAETAAIEEFESFPLPHGLTQWVFHRINLGPDIVGQLLEVPREEDTLGPPPTAGEKMFVRLFSQDQSVFEEVRKGGLLLASWTPARLSREVRDTLLASFGVSATPPAIPSSIPWAQSVDIVLDPSSPFLQKGSLAAVKLMNRAFRQTEPRWKFLTLYQVLEHGFLLSILNALNSQFLQHPAQAINDAAEALKNDLTKFVELIKAHSLNSTFDELESNLKSIELTNRFAAALERQWQKESSRVQGDQKGAFICYKIRCSIVHAGDSLTYEAYTDADAAVILALSCLEKAVIKYAGISVA